MMNRIYMHAYVIKVTDKHNQILSAFSGPILKKKNISEFINKFYCVSVGFFSYLTWILNYSQLNISTFFKIQIIFAYKVIKVEIRTLEVGFLVQSVDKTNSFQSLYIQN